MAITTKAINAKLAKTGHPVEIVKGDGYIYFSYDDLDNGGKYDTYSIYTPYLNQHTVAEWVAYGVEFAEAMVEDRYDAGSGRIRPRKEA